MCNNPQQKVNSSAYQRVTKMTCCWALPSHNTQSSLKKRMGWFFCCIFFFFRDGRKGLFRLQTNQSMQQQVAWSTFKMSDTFVTGSAPGPPAWTWGISPCCRCCWGCGCVSGGIDICPTRDASEHCSFLPHSKMCNSFEHRFCWARNVLASVIGTQVIRKALSILPNGLSLLKAAVCSVVLFSVFTWAFQ